MSRHNIQCKRVDRALGPADLFPELGKVLWYACNGDYVLPRSMKFLCSKGIGTGAKHLLTNPDVLKRELVSRWDANVAKKITTTQTVQLVGKLKSFVEQAPFSIFGKVRLIIFRNLAAPFLYVRQALSHPQVLWTMKAAT